MLWETRSEKQERQQRNQAKAKCSACSIARLDQRTMLAHALSLIVGADLQAGVWLSSFVDFLRLSGLNTDRIPGSAC